MIYVDQNAQPSEIVRTLWRELGPEVCSSIALMIAARESRLLVLDVSGLTEANDEGQ
jgi:hypothetical protein